MTTVELATIERVLERQRQRESWAATTHRLMAQLAGDLLGHLGTIELCLSEYRQQQGIDESRGETRHLSWGLQAVESIYTLVKRYAMSHAMPEPTFRPCTVHELMETALQRCQALLRSRRLSPTIEYDQQWHCVADRSLLLCALMRILLVGVSSFEAPQQVRMTIHQVGDWLCAELACRGTPAPQTSRACMAEGVFLEDPQFLQLHQILQLHRGGVMFEGTAEALRCLLVWPREQVVAEAAPHPQSPSLKVVGAVTS